MNVLIWFRSDLRATALPALTRAARAGRVLPLFIVEPDLWSQPERSARHWDFVAECLADLRQDLAGLGAPLVVRVGSAQTVLERLCRQHDIASILTTPERGSPWQDQRSAQLKDWAQAARIDWQEITTPPDPDCAPPALSPLAGIEPGSIPQARALRLEEDRCPHRQIGGRKQAEALLQGFLTRRAEGYRAAQAAPLLAERAGSRLSPYLAQGVLARAEVALAVAQQRNMQPGAALSAGLSSFANRLTLGCGDLAQPLLPPSSPAMASGLCQAWQAGESGLPFADACMRYLNATGWLPDALRAMLAGFGLSLLGLDLRQAGLVLARRMTDYDPALFWPRLQALARSGVPDDPVRLGQRHDPCGTFTRRWVPELAGLPDDVVHCPWKWPGARGFLGKRYPEPIIDSRSALQALRATRHLAPQMGQGLWQPAQSQLRLNL
jgi:deoxyribodipyrimidine photo-lyase